MTTNAETAQTVETAGAYYVRRVVLPEVALFFSALLLIGLTRLCWPDVVGFLAFVVAGCALWLDRRLFTLVPTSMWAERRRTQATRAALAACVVFAFLLLGVLLSPRFPVRLFLIAWLARLLVPGLFSLCWYSTFVADIFPRMQSVQVSADHQNALENLARRTELAGKQTKLADATEEVATRREDAARRGRRTRAIHEARSSVLNFYRSFAAVLRPFLGGEHLQAELRAAIPDSATEEQAFAGACGLLTKLEGYIQGLDAERKAEQVGRQQRRERIAGIETQITTIGEEIQAFRRNTAADPELRDGEIQLLEAKRRSLLEQRVMLFSSVA